MIGTKLVLDKGTDIDSIVVTFGDSVKNQVRYHRYIDVHETFVSSGIKSF